MVHKRFTNYVIITINTINTIANNKKNNISEISENFVLNKVSTRYAHYSPYMKYSNNSWYNLDFESGGLIRTTNLCTQNIGVMK